METIKLRLSSASTLLMHSTAGMNPFDETAKQMKAIRAKKTKQTDEDRLLLMELEWRQALYYDEELGPIVPAINIEGMIRDGAKIEKRGKDVVRGLRVLNDVPLIYDGPRDMTSMYQSGRFTDIRIVKVQQSRIPRTRPKFEDWVIEFDLEVDTEIFNIEDVIRFATYGGRYVGLCDYRPRFGRFTVEVFQADEWQSVEYNGSEVESQKAKKLKEKMAKAQAELVALEA
jgi:hypothetical protein